MRALQTLIRLLSGLNLSVVTVCKYATVVLVALITAIVCAGVFWRYFLNDALSWTEETAKFLMVWLVFVASPIALRTGGHASIDALPNLLPPRARQALYTLAFAVVVVLMVVLVYQGVAFALNARSQITATTGISMFYVFVSMPVGGAIMLLIGVEMLLRAVAGVLDPAQGLDLNIHAAEVEASGE